jgi:CheY-like chemotaxis protein
MLMMPPVHGELRSAAGISSAWGKDRNNPRTRGFPVKSLSNSALASTSILVVSPEQDILKLIGGQLSSLGFKRIEAHDSVAKAVESADASSSGIVFLHDALSDNGAERMAIFLREKNAATKLVLVSGAPAANTKLFDQVIRESLSTFTLSKAVASLFAA